MRIQEFHKGMKDHFEIDKPGEYLDELFLKDKLVKIDLFKFDDWLHAEFGGYEETHGFSMKELIEDRFSQEASDFIISIL
jgi:hypothetical protein